MHLKTLTLRGFKSFAHRVRLELGTGITVVVGPNGSGKSNLADAVKWVLGEQGANPLRAGAMEDLIFSGSSHCSPGKLAEVALSLDNSGSVLPLDSSEVSVGRRVHRSGETEYLINQRPVRLRDVQELLADARLGRGLTSIINQGRIEEVLAPKPEDRRLYLEEIAGTLKYRHRKARALRKLEKVEANALRARDVEAEVRRQLRPLEQQAGRARTYNQLRGKLRDLELRLAVDRLRRLRGDWDETSAAIAGARSREQVAEARLKEAEDGLARLRGELEREEDLLGSGLTLENRLAALLERLESVVRLCREKDRGLEPRLSEISARVQQLRGDRGRLVREREEARSAAQGAEGQAGRDELEAALREMARLKEARERALAELRGLEGKTQNSRERSAALQGEPADRPGRLDRRDREASALKGQLSQVAQEIVDLRESARKVERELHTMTTRAPAEAASLADEEARFQELEGSLAELRDRCAGAREEIAAIRGRREALERLDAPSAPDPARGGKQADLGDLGELAELCRAQPQHEAAIEGFLGELVSARVVRSAAVAVEMLARLKADGQGRTALVALDLLGEALPAADVEVATPLANALTIDGEAAKLSRAFSACYLAPDLETALALARKHGPAYAFVTPSGDVVGPRGFVRLGAGNGDSRLALRREIKTLGLRQEKLMRTAREDKAILEDREAAVRKLALSVERRRRDLETLRREEARLFSLEEDVAKSLDRASARKTRLEQELSVHQEETERTAERERAAREELSELQSELERTEAERSRLQNELSGTEPRLEDAARRATALEVQARVVSARLDEHKARMRRASQEIDRLNEALLSLERVRAALAHAASRPGRLARRVADLAGRAKEAGDRAATATAARRETLGQLRGQLSAAERLKEEAHENRSTAAQALHGYDIRLAELKIQVDLAVSKITDHHEEPLDTALALPPLEEPEEVSSRRAAELRARISALGAVNPAAEEEYRSLKERHSFLSHQLADLEESRKALERLTKELDQKVREAFMATFEAVAENFAELVELLFSGARGRLSLTAEDLLEAGVEIQVELPGRRFTRLSLLSGGERALAALAFSFALYRAKPAPFCLLDEVDAALDDVNLGKFVGLLERYKGESQFVVITHQKRTMKAADLLYGVSVQPDGSSAVVSQRV